MFICRGEAGALNMQSACATRPQEKVTVVPSEETTLLYDSAVYFVGDIAKNVAVLRGSCERQYCGKPCIKVNPADIQKLCIQTSR